MKRIILEYSFLSLFESFNGGSILLFESLNVRKWSRLEGIHIPLYFFKISNFHSRPKFGGIEGNKIRFNDFFTITLKIPLHI